MKRIKGLSEAQILASIEKVVAQLAPGFTFGFYDVDDIKQEATIMALRKLAKFNVEKATFKSDALQAKLENFLFVSVQNLLCNFKRDKFHRTDPPCAACYAGDHCEPNGCEVYNLWVKRNASKMNIMRPGQIDSETFDVSQNDEADLVGEVGISEVFSRIDKELPVEYRSDYLKMRAGASVPKARRALIEDFIKSLFKDAICE